VDPGTSPATGPAAAFATTVTPAEFDELDRRVLETTRLARLAEWDLARLLGEMDRRKAFRARGYSGAAHYGEVRGIGPVARIKNLILVDRRLPELPEILRAYLDGRISLEKAAALCTVARTDDQSPWVETATRQPTAIVQNQVRRTRVARGEVPDLMRRVFELTEADSDAFDQARGQLFRDLGRPVECGEAVGRLSRHYMDCRDKRRRKTVPQGRDLPRDPRDLPQAVPGSRYVPAEVARAVWIRDHGRCRVPNCSHTGWVHLGHIDERRNGGLPTVENLMCICAAHNYMQEAGELLVEGDAGNPLFLHADGRPFGDPPPERPP